VGRYDSTYQKATMEAAAHIATIKEDLANSAFPSNNKQPKVGVAGRTSK
jgi:hypothetical protein